ncbi:cytochrome c554/c'-like protein [Chitinophaga dinghuensis]|uniref:Cytochrome c554/c'-like protein n=1 Tax=Chitinophaga dinghuensis TaxID=1539050 RepID=A0A327W584_9BACT|nr:cytochrome c554/c'-like protein [Chitinophaga dinghuensis]
MYKRSFYLTACIVAGVLILSQCIGKKADPRGDAFSGDASCSSCHPSAFAAHQHSAHAFASAPADAHTILGKFIAPHDSFLFPGNVVVKMEQNNNRYYQSAYLNGQLREQATFDITIGQGRKAQTYLSWHDNKYFQLPLSWFRPVMNWANSPGFPATYPYYKREIASSCFGCHSSYVKFETSFEGVRKMESFPENKVVFGITCERCHGPAQEHVAFHMQYPDEKTAHAITRIGQLSRQQQVDMCAVCHAGLKTPQRDLFEFRPGDRLSDYIMADYFATPAEQSANDVHGRQYQLLTASKCFRMSNQLTCTTCHDPHEDKRNDLTAYTKKCMSCHQPGSTNFCTQKADMQVLQEKCINCHMPEQPSGVITLLASGQQQPVADSLRSHLIKVYR